VKEAALLKGSRNIGGVAMAEGTGVGWGSAAKIQLVGVEEAREQQVRALAILNRVGGCAAIRHRVAASILSQTNGFIAEAGFTHSLSPATNCTYG
jgi:hypothetical protein